MSNVLLELYATEIKAYYHLHCMNCTIDKGGIGNGSKNLELSAFRMTLGNLISDSESNASSAFFSKPIVLPVLIIAISDLLAPKPSMAVLTS